MSHIVNRRKESRRIGPAARVHRAMRGVRWERGRRAHDAEIRAWWEEEGRPEVLVHVDHIPAFESPVWFVPDWPESWSVWEYRVTEDRVEAKFYDPMTYAPDALSGLDYWRNHFNGEPNE